MAVSSQLQGAAIRVDGLDELQRAFTAADRALRQDLRDALMEAAAPVRSDAQVLAQMNIRRMPLGSPWTRMRIGILAGGTVVYVAPVERGVKARGRARFRRPKFAFTLQEKAMDPAAIHNRGRVIKRLDQLVGDVCDLWDRQPDAR